MRGQFGRLGNHGSVQVAQLIARSTHPFHRFCQQHRRVGALEIHIGVGKMPPDITQTHGTKQSIGDGMQQSIGIRMAHQAHAVGHLNATEHQAAAGHEDVGIPAFAHAERQNGLLGFGHERLLKMASANAKSSG